MGGESVWQVVARNAETRGARQAFVCDDATLTHAAFKARCESVAAGLVARGLRPGERLAVLAENHLDVPVLLGACARIGAVLVPLNWRLQTAELAAALADSAPHGLVTDESTLAAATALLEDHPDVAIRLILGETTASFAAVRDLAGDPAGLPEPAGPDDVLLLIYTAAVDGVARGAMLTGGNLAASAQLLGEAVGLDETDVFLGNLPAFHVMAQSLSFAVQYAGGSTVVRRRFEADDAAATIAREGATLVGSFPPMLSAILDAAASAGHDLGSLRAVAGLEAPALVERLEREWPAARFWIGFGQSETSGFVSIGRASERPGSSGRIGPFVEVAIVDEEDRPQAPGENGEIVVRGGVVMQGYWKREAENAVVGRNGWHHTGDLGRIDAEGWLHYAGRSPAKELIKTGGENVYPSEVERALREDAAVFDAVVFGVPDTRWGERVVAVVTLNEGASADEAGLRRSVGERIAGYKRPSQILFVDALARQSSGAVDRTAVKDAHRSAFDGTIAPATDVGPSHVGEKSA